MIDKLFLENTKSAMTNPETNFPSPTAIDNRLTKYTSSQSESISNLTGFNDCLLLIDC